MTDDNLDEEWMEAVCRGDRQAYQSLVHRHSQAIAHYAYRLLDNAAEAEDITQETFLRLWLNAHKWQPDKARLTTWLHRITHNLCVDLQRKQGRMQTGNDGEEMDRQSADKSTSWQATRQDEAGVQPDAVAQDAQLQLLRQALNELPENQRSALTLCTFSGFSNQEAAAIMGLSVKALESALARARRSLRDKWA